jgi:hypothetical protein
MVRSIRAREGLSFIVSPAGRKRLAERTNADAAGFATKLLVVHGTGRKRAMTGGKQSPSPLSLASTSSPSIYHLNGW